MRFWTFGQLVVGLLMLPEALWGLSGLVGILLPAFFVRMWPLNSALAILWFLSAVLGVASASLALLGARQLLAGRAVGRGLHLSFAGTLCFWAHVIGRESALFALRTRGDALFNSYALSVAIRATVTTAVLFRRRNSGTDGTFPA